MSITFLLPFLFASPVDSSPSTCAARGTPLLEMAERNDNHNRATVTRIYDNGAWTVRSGRTIERGCFERKEVRQIRRAIQRAPFDITQSSIACFAYDPNFTEYRVRGELRFTERLCSGKAADATTMRALELVKAELAEEMTEHAPAPAPPVVPPPVVQPPPVRPPVQACRATGTPLFEIRLRSEAAEPTSVTAIYSTGAWTFQPIDKDGRVGAMSTGCLDATTLQQVRQVITQSSWDMTTSPITCRAYSPSFTEYYVHGQREYTARLCGAERLDEKSLGAIKIIEGELAKVLPSRIR